MAVTRRALLASAGAAAGLHPLLPAALRAAGAGAEAADRNQLVVVFLAGGNDGLNTVIPTGDLPQQPRLSVYRKVRPSLRVDKPLPLDRPGDRDEKLGLHPALPTVHRLYREGRLAVVQGVDYPGHSYSHFASADIWHSGEPAGSPDSGWLGRHLDRVGVDGGLRGISVGGSELPLALRGRKTSGVAISSVDATRFADNGEAGAAARHAALALYERHPASEPLRRRVGQACRQTVTMTADLARAKKAPRGKSRLADNLLTARTLLEQNLGVECVHVTYGGFDTHTGQAAAHQTRLGDLDAALAAFYYGTGGDGRPLPAALAARTVVLVVSEFGRRIGENGTGPYAGTDHGAAAPVFLIGPAGRIGAGLHGDHPALGTAAAPADNLTMTTDLRRVYQSVLERWLRDPDPAYGRSYPALPGLFR